MFECTVPNENSWDPVIERIADEIRGGMQVGLSGPLGAGKSFLVQRLLRHWGFQEDVPSPTFVLATQYELRQFVVEHWDLYRVKELPEELLEVPAENLVRLIEWPERGAVPLPLDVQVNIQLLDAMDPMKGRLVQLRWL